MEALQAPPMEPMEDMDEDIADKVGRCPGGGREQRERENMNESGCVWDEILTSQLQGALESLLGVRVTSSCRVHRVGGCQQCEG